MLTSPWPRSDPNYFHSRVLLGTSLSDEESLPEGTVGHFRVTFGALSLSLLFPWLCTLLFLCLLCIFICQILAGGWAAFTIYIQLCFSCRSFYKDTEYVHGFSPLLPFLPSPFLSFFFLCLKQEECWGYRGQNLLLFWSRTSLQP